jgi:hypothetical protein
MITAEFTKTFANVGSGIDVVAEGGAFARGRGAHPSVWIRVGGAGTLVIVYRRALPPETEYADTIAVGAGETIFVAALAIGASSTATAITVGW